MTEKKLKLKTPIELGKMLDNPNAAELINYIDKLHSTIKNYQIVIDQAIRVNENVNS